MSDSFQQPVFDNSLLLPQWIQYNGQHSPEHPLFVYCSPSSHAKLQSIKWSRAARAIENAAHIVYSHLKLDPRPQTGAPLVVGILANIDAITYHTIIWGVLRAGATVFPISTRNSSVAVAHLLKNTGTCALYVSKDEPIQTLVSSTLAILEDHGITEHIIPSFRELYSEEKKTTHTDLPKYYKDPTTIDSPAVILHSSGTTSFPKPISLSHRTVLQWTRILGIQGADMTKHRIATHGLPVFHGMGYFLVAWAARSGVSIAVFPPQDPPMLPSPQNVLESAVACQSTVMLSVPLFIELWSHSTDTVEKMRRFDGVIYAGGPLNKRIGDGLLRAGVSLVGFYGATETGPVSQMIFRKDDPGWDWLSLSPECVSIFVPQEDQPDVFELVLPESPNYSPAVSNTVVEGKRAYATNDLVTRHPTDPSRFKVYGRADDQLILSTGEKTNPGPLETIICKNPLVDKAIMFGRGREQNGILLQPAKGHEIDPNDFKALALYRNKIWPSIEQVNDFAPTHSRIFKEMILVTDPSKLMEMTAKLAPHRASTLEAYEEEIEAAYTFVKLSSMTGVKPPSDWTPAQVLEFVRSIVHSVMCKEVRDDDDIFLQGGDSIHAILIRNKLMQAVPNKDSSRRASQSFVYANPSINQLATQLLNIVRSTEEESDENLSKVKKMSNLVSEFSTGFPAHRPTASSEHTLGEVVLITGTTGGLGSQLLAHIASFPDVVHVYALNRKSSNGNRSLRARQIDALTRRGLDASIIELPKVTLVEGDTAANTLGIDSVVFNEIRDTVTLIIHNAWRMNFNMTLDSFKPIICGVRNLIDMALQSPKTNPPKFIFTGSVGVYRNWKFTERPLEVSVDDPRLALGSGYSESKWVSERILEEAAKSTPLHPIIVRIGQMTSNSSGAWNSGDWLPAIVRSGQVLGVLPSREDYIAWISLDTAAQAIFDFRRSKSQYLHLTHPSPVLWATVFEVFSSILNVPLVSWKEWLVKLEKDDSGPERNPALHLLDFFRAASSVDLPHREALSIPLLDITQALRASPSLADPHLPQITREDAESWIIYWRKIGFLAA